MVDEKAVAEFWADRFGLSKEYQSIRELIDDLMQPVIDPRESRYLEHMSHAQRELFRTLTRALQDPVTQSVLFLPAMTLAGYPASRLGMMLLASRIRRGGRLDDLVSVAKDYKKRLRHLFLSEYQALNAPDTVETADDLAATQQSGRKNDE